MIASAYPTLSGFFSALYQPRRLCGCSSATIQQYMIVIRHFSRFLERPPQVADLDEARISEFLVWFAVGRKIATVWNARKHLLALANYAHRKGLLYEVPDIMKIRIPKKLPTAYSVADIAKLLEAAGGMAGMVGRIPAKRFWPALFLVAYDTGARSAAIWALEWCDYQPPYLLFRAETSKQKSDQLLKISRQTADALYAIHLSAEQFMFPWPGCRRVKYLRIKAIFKTAGLPCGRRDLLQRIRRTTATLMHNAGGDACQQLGHSSDAITRAHYLDPRDSKQAADILPRPTLALDSRQQMLFH